jgi:DNA-binding CsgD family transcriptional regulator
LALNEDLARLLAWDESATGQDHHALHPFSTVTPSNCSICDGLVRARRRIGLASTELATTLLGRRQWLQLTRLPLWDGESFVGLGVIVFDRTVQRERDMLVENLLGIVRTLAYERRGEPADVDIPLAAPATLTSREREVLHCLVAGMGARNIAQRLAVSYNTARNHVQNVLHKLEVHSKSQAVAVAVAHGIVETEDLARLLTDPIAAADFEQSA